MSVTYHFYLRKDYKKKNGTYPIYLRITSDRKHKYLSTGESIKEKYWNPNDEKVRKNHPSSDAINTRLNNKLREIQNIHAELTYHGKESAKAIKQRLKTNSKAEFFALADQLKKDLEKEKKLYPIKTLDVVLRKIEKFEGERSLPLKNIDTAWLESFEKYLKTEYGNAKSTISKNFEPIRKIIQNALQSHLMRTDPFVGFNGAKRGKPSPKTKLSLKQIKKIEKLKLKKDSLLWHSRNAFLFSFYSGGIRFGDVCCLKWSNVKNGRLSYEMNKNQKTFSTQLNDFQNDILSRYSGKQKEYIFPFLNSHKKYDPVALRKAIGAKNALVNKYLRKIATKAEIDKTISFHVSRHSFAQYAVQEKGLDVYELMQTLRHTKLETTQRYLKSLDEELADKAMKKVF